MKKMICALVVLGLLATPGWAATIWYVGVDNGNNSDMEHENQGDDLFYVHPGDYTSTYGYNVADSLFTLAGVVRATPEPLIDGGSTAEGMERALVGPGNERATNLLFQMSDFEANAHDQYRLLADLISPGGGDPAPVGSNHDLAFYLNGQQIYSINGVKTSYLVDVTFDGSMAVEGSNVLSIVRTGGTTNVAWIQFDYIGLEYVVPEPASLALLAMAAAGLGRYIRRRR